MNYSEGYTKEELAELDKEWKLVQEQIWHEEMLQAKKDIKCLRNQKRKLSKSRLSDLDHLFYVYENSHNYKIVQVQGGIKEEDRDMRYHYFQEGECSQDITGEYSGSGTVWYPIGNQNYFKFDYFG